MTLREHLHRLTHWETWDYRVKLVPLAPVWLWHGLRSGSVWFFSAANPTLTFGGFQGETKREMYAQLPPERIPRTRYVDPAEGIVEVERHLTEAGFSYPFAVKPDVGMMGLLFRKIHNAAEFRRYHERAPAGYLVQEFIAYPLELSVFYYRFPGKAQGTITGFVRKESLEVVGDGQRTLWELMRRYEPVRYRLGEMRAKHTGQLQRVLAAGEPYRLSHALNQTRGGRLVSLAHEKDERLLAVFDALSHHAGHFYFGRYDLKCRSVEDLKAGRHFRILEYNGSGAAPHHVYGNGHSLLQAYRIILHHWAVLAEISRQNHRAGVPYWSFREGWRFLRESERHLRVLKTRDAEAVRNADSD
jgi:hypothetical protein